MNYSMHCPVEDCEHVMMTEADGDESAVEGLMVKGNEHFAEAGHEMDKSMTPEMQKEMTMKFMKKGE